MFFFALNDQTTHPCAHGSDANFNEFKFTKTPLLNWEKMNDVLEQNGDPLYKSDIKAAPSG